MTRNLCLLSDSYKPSHWKGYPPGTSHVYSFFESRGGRWPETVFFGLQYFLDTYLATPVTQADVDEAEALYGAHLGPGIFNRAGWQHIVDAHGGRLPLRIKAVPEGSVIPVSNVLMTVENTDPAVPWLTNYVESLLVQVWYPSTVATQSRAMKARILAALEKTGTPEAIDFKLHDFGFRGSTSPESSAIGGCAHLINFKGTDTVPALVLARDIYGEPMAGFSIPAAEHSTITAWGREREVEAYRNMLAQFPTGLVAVVSDSYDVFAACRDLWGTTLREQVLERDGVLVIRPDSGYPPEIVCQVLRILMDRFGAEKNDKGYLVLHPKVRVIQGDGIDADMVDAILDEMKEAGWSADNIAFGSGGGLLQKVDRDTSKYAFKCSSVVVNGQSREVMKEPVTDPGKRSKAGRLALVNLSFGGVGTVREDHVGRDRENLLQDVFVNGSMTNRTTLAEVRERANIGSSVLVVS